MKKSCIILIGLFLIYSTSFADDRPLTKYVNPFIGTGGHGHTFPGATLPFGMVQLSPDTRLKGWDGCSAYHYSDSIVYGFSHTHLSGTGCSDYGDILLMPTTGEVKINNGFPDNPEEGYCSKFSHEKESASPGLYKVFLDDYNVDVELTATKRSGFHKYTFPEGKESNLIIDLNHRDKVTDSYIKIRDNREIEGYRISSAWAKEQHVYFVARFSHPFYESGIAIDDAISKEIQSANGTNLKAYFRFNTTKKREFYVKVGISAVSIEGARKNLYDEIPAWDFEGVKKNAQNIWNKALNKIHVEGGTDDQKTVFYTALYHSMMAPNLYSDIDGKYRGTDLKVHESAGFDYYTVFSLWDTYRATHPLFTIIEQKRTVDFIKTFLAQYKDGGRLPVWELAANYTGCMIGYHSAPVIVDAYMKGIDDFDDDKALEAMMHSAGLEWLGLDAYKEFLYIPADREHESVSKTLEYAYDDWCIAQMAKKMDKEDIYKHYMRWAQAYKNLFDPGTGFMRPRMNGAFITPFEPAEVNNHFTEANSWQYSFYVPQDIKGLIGLHGGDDNFTKKLDGLFSADSKTSGRNQADISGLIGQYAHGNEPSHHTAYLYNYTGKPWKTQEVARLIMDSLYFNAPDGLCGNEDCGQMSSWYVFSAMGFYPVCPGRDLYQIGTPIFDKVIINLENGDEFSIVAKNVSKENKYIQSADFKEAKYNKSYLKHEDITEDGTITFNMGPAPNEKWASGGNSISATAIKDNLIQSAPVISTFTRVFKDELTFSISAANEADIYYTLDGTEPTLQSTKYSSEINLKTTTVLKMFAHHKDYGRSSIITAEFARVPTNWTVELNCKYSKQYSAGGPNGLIDGIRGEKNFRLGGWQGYQDTDFEAIIDLGKVTAVNSIAAGFLQDVGSWIWMPPSVEFEVSDDGKNFDRIAIFNHNLPDDQYGAVIMDFKRSFKGINARYVKVHAVKYGDIPDWHAGAGGKSLIFVDEITIK